MSITFKGVKTSYSGMQKRGLTASEVPFGAFVTRSADGTVKAQVTNVPYEYLGVAVESEVEQRPYDGFFAAGKNVSYVATGVVNAWLLGGDTVDSGDFVRFPATLGAGTESLGVVSVESTPTTRTAYSVGRVTQTSDAGSADYDQTIASISGSTVTFGLAATLTALGLVRGDYVVIDSNEAAEVNRIVDPAASTVTCTCVKPPLATHANAIKMYKLVPIEIELI